MQLIVDRLRAAGCVFAEDEAALLIKTARDEAELEAMVKRRVGGLPLEHVLGWVQFAGERYAISPGVFVPRPRTEFLVEHVAALAPWARLCSTCAAVPAPWGQRSPA